MLRRGPRCGAPPAGLAELPLDEAERRGCRGTEHESGIAVTAVECAVLDVEVPVAAVLGLAGTGSWAVIASLQAYLRACRHESGHLAGDR